MYDIKLIKIFEYEQINFDCKPTINYFNKLIKQGQKNEIDNITKNINGLTNNEIILKAQNKLKN
jgi:hypothetical protein